MTGCPRDGLSPFPLSHRGRKRDPKRSPRTAARHRNDRRGDAREWVAPTGGPEMKRGLASQPARTGFAEGHVPESRDTGWRFPSPLNFPSPSSFPSPSRGLRHLAWQKGLGPRKGGRCLRKGDQRQGDPGPVAGRVSKVELAVTGTLAGHVPIGPVPRVTPTPYTYPGTVPARRDSYSLYGKASTGDVGRVAGREVACKENGEERCAGCTGKAERR